MRDITAMDLETTKRRKWRKLLGVVFSLFIFSLFVAVPFTFASEEQEEVTILFTHDMHDNFLPTKVEQDGQIIELGGFARLKTAIDAQQKENKTVVLVDAGDFSMGTLFQTIYRSQAPELRIMGQIGYDAVTLGNHEFDYRATGLTDSLNAALQSEDSLPTIVQSNMNFQEDEKGNLTESLSNLKQALEHYGLKDYTIIERNGIRIGIFGVMGKDSVDKAPMAEVKFSDAVEQTKRVTKILKEQEKVDVIICLSHSGINVDSGKSEDEQLAKKVPDINVIISGHTHSKLEEPIVVGDTIIGSCEEYGKYLGVIKLSKQDKDWKLNQYELVSVDKQWQEDQGISDQITEYKEMVQSEYFDKFDMNLDDVVAQTDYNFESIQEILNNHRESKLANFIGDAYRYAVKKTEGEAYEPVAAAVVPAGTIRATFLKGDITTADIFSVSCLGMGVDNMPGYPLISVYLSGKELKTICEVDASVAPLMIDAQLFPSGLKYKFNPNRLIFNKLETCMLEQEDGTVQEIDDTKLYRVVVGLYSAQMLSVVGEKSFGLLSIVPKTADGTPITDFEQQIIYNTADGKKKELKEWYALVEYMQSFEKENGVSQIPAYYSELHNRKTVEKDKNIIKLLQNPNKIAMVVYCIVFALVVIIILLVLFIRKRIIKIRKNEAGKKRRLK